MRGLLCGLVLLVNLSTAVAVGYGGPDEFVLRENAKGGFFRVGHMGHLNPPMLLGALTTIETAMKALKIKHDEGAISAACQVLANHKSQSSWI